MIDKNRTSQNKCILMHSKDHSILERVYLLLKGSHIGHWPFLDQLHMRLRDFQFLCSVLFGQNSLLIQILQY